MSAIWNDIRFAWRTLRKDWLVNALAAVSLALALAGNTTVFSMVNSFLFRPLPFPEAERVVLMGEREAGAPRALTVSPANLVDWRERNRSFEGLAGYLPGSVSFGIDARPVTIPSAKVSPEFFDVLGSPPARGRSFLAEEGIPGNDRVVVVTAELAAERLSDFADPLGVDVMLNGRSYTVIGVMPEGFEFFFPGVDVWIPLALDPEQVSRDQRSLMSIARMKPGLTMALVREDMERVYAELVNEYPESNNGWAIDILNFRYEIPAPEGRVLFGMLQGTVFFVLLIACVNIANLLMARGQRRHREIALRTILGANRWQILRQLLVESTMLAVVAGAVGLGLAYVAVGAISASFASVTVAHYRPAIEMPVLLVSLAMTLLSGLLFGIAPAFQSFKVDLAASVKDGGRGVAGTAGRRLLSRGLVVAEIALSLILLAGGSLMVRSFLELREADPGFDDEGLIAIPVTLPSAIESAPERAAFIASLTAAAAAVPGVESATAATALPLNVFAVADAFTIDGRALAPGDPRPRALWVGAPPDYLDVLGVGMVRGRFFSAADRADASPVVAVSARLAELHFPDEVAIGQHIQFHDQSREIVGIVGDTRQSLVSQGQAADAVIYVPLAQEAPPALMLMARSAVEPGTVMSSLRTQLQGVDQRLVVGNIQTLREILDQLFVGIDLMNTVLTMFGNLALLLAALGTYGVLAYNVALRSQEIGVRMALGAQQREVVRMITRQGVILGLIGLAVGAPGVLIIIRLLRFALSNMATIEAGPVFGVALVLLASTVAASIIPAIRAARLDPVEVLRDQ